MKKIFTCAHVTDDLLNAWLQHMRDFDTAHPGCHFEVYADVPDASPREIAKLMQVNPSLTIEEYFERKKR